MNEGEYYGLSWLLGRFEAVFRLHMSQTCCRCPGTGHLVQYGHEQWDVGDSIGPRAGTGGTLGSRSRPLTSPSEAIHSIMSRAIRTKTTTSPREPVAMIPMSGNTVVGDNLASAGLTQPERTLVAGGRRQVSESAAKEYQIEEALTKMESEWTDCHLEIVGYRETGTGVLKGVDDINAVLDEQVGWN